MKIYIVCIDTNPYKILQAFYKYDKAIDFINRYNEDLQNDNEAFLLEPIYLV